MTFRSNPLAAKMSRNAHKILFAAAFLCLAVSADAQSAWKPASPVKVVVPFATGGAAVNA